MDDLDPYTARLFQIESGGNPRAVTGSNMGLGQFGPAEQRQFGITDPYDPQQQVNAVARERAAHSQIFQNRFGTAPTDGQLYLMHQQGVAGGPALIGADPSTPAWQAIRPYYGSDAVAQRAIAGNIPRGSSLYGRNVNDISAGDFSNFWINKFEGSPAAPSLVAGNAPVPAAAPAPQPVAALGSDADAFSGAGTLGGAGGNGIGQLAGSLIKQGEGGDQPAPPPMQQQPLPSTAQRLASVLARLGGLQQTLPSDVSRRLIDVIGKSSGFSA